MILGGEGIEGLDMDELLRIQRMGSGIQIKEISPSMIELVLGERLPLHPT